MATRFKGKDGKEMTAREWVALLEKEGKPVLPRFRAMAEAEEVAEPTKKSTKKKGGEGE